MVGSSGALWLAQLTYRASTAKLLDISLSYAIILSVNPIHHLFIPTVFQLLAMNL